MLYSKEILNHHVFHFYIIRDEKDDSPSTHVKKSKPVSCPSHDDICTVTHQSEKNDIGQSINWKTECW